MSLTNDEETRLKANVAVMRAHAQWNKKARLMQQEIQAEFDAIDKRIRAQYKADLTRLQQNKDNAETALKLLLEQ